MPKAVAPARLLVCGVGWLRVGFVEVYSTTTYVHTCVSGLGALRYRDRDGNRNLYQCGTGTGTGTGGAGGAGTTVTDRTNLAESLLCSLRNSSHTCTSTNMVYDGAKSWSQVCDVTQSRYKSFHSDDHYVSATNSTSQEMARAPEVPPHNEWLTSSGYEHTTCFMCGVPFVILQNLPDRYRLHGRGCRGPVRCDAEVRRCSIY